MATVRYTLDNFEFEWDSEKALINIQKHGISFNEASKIITLPDTKFFEDKFSNEERWLAIGTEHGFNFLLVVHTYREKDGSEIIRIISARKITQNEVTKYANS